MADSHAPSGFDRLWERYPWPAAPPVPGAVATGREAAGFDLLLKALVDLGRPNPVILEIGAEFGGSTRKFLGVPGAYVVSVDPWPDSYGAGSFPELRQFLGRENGMYELFQSFTFDDRDRLATVREPSPAGPLTVRDAGVGVDLVYLDGDHRYDPVLRDLTVVATLFPGAAISGSDWLFNPVNPKYEGIRFPVQTAVRRYASVSDLHVESDGDTWLLDPTRPFNLDRPVPHFSAGGAGELPAAADLPGRIKALEGAVRDLDQRGKTAEQTLKRIEGLLRGLPTARLVRKARSVIGARR